MERHEGQNHQNRKHHATNQRRRLQQEQIERRTIPERGKAAKMIVVGLHAPVREIQCSGHHDGRAEQWRRQRKQQTAGRDRVSRNEHIGEKVHHQIERIAGPVRQHLVHFQPPRKRPVETVHEQRQPEPAEHRGPVLSHRFQHCDQRDGSAQCGEDVNAEGPQAGCGGKQLVRRTGLTHQ